MWVRNNGREAFSDQFDGERFTIAPGAAEEMTVDCAKLVFGFGEDDKRRAIRRLGWAPTENDMPKALAKLNAFSFHMEPPSDPYAPVSDTEPAARSSGRVAGADQPRRKRKYKKRAKRAARAPSAPSAPSSEPLPAASPAAG